jgi:hypothetical protein
VAVGATCFTVLMAASTVGRTAIGILLRWSERGISPGVGIDSNSIGRLEVDPR